MKTTLQFLLFLFACSSFAQIALEHTYEEGIINRVNLEYSGEKYYVLKQNTNNLKLYNPDHSLWKSIVLPAAQPSMFTFISLYHISEAKINPDTDLEIIFSSYNPNTGKYDGKVISENGTVLLTIPDITEVRISEVDGLSDKLIAKCTYNNIRTIVYSMPQLNKNMNIMDNKISLELALKV